MVYMNALLLVSCLSFSSASYPTLRGSTKEKGEARALQGGGSFFGECTVSNFIAAVGSASQLASLLNVSNDQAALQAALSTKCAAALVPVLPER